MPRNPYSGPDEGLLRTYLLAKATVLDAGFESEIVWQENLSLGCINTQTFLREAAWVVLSSGMRESVIRKIFPAIEKAFGSWSDASWITKNASSCRVAALQHFRHEKKIDAILSIAEVVASNGVASLIEELSNLGPDALLSLPFMGPATSRHLAKNLGVDVAKPDRHLVRVAFALGYPSADELCKHISTEVEDSTAVVDLVIWRFATLCPNYVECFVQGFEQAHCALTTSSEVATWTRPSLFEGTSWVAG